MKKIYGFPGKTEVIMDFPVGKATIKATFKNGRLGTLHDVPAQLETENPIVMAAIENDIRFKGGMIVLMNTYFTQEEQAELAKKDVIVKPNGEIVEPEVFEDITEWSDVTAKLKEYGVPATEYRSKLRAKEAAERLNLRFPNFNFD